MQSFICNSCKIETPIDQDNHNGVCFTCSNHDKKQVRKVFDSIKEITEIEFKTEPGKEMQIGLQGAWDILNP